MRRQIFLSLASSLALLVISGCSGTDGAGGDASRLTAECTDGAVIPEAWICPDELVVECEDGGADPDLIFFTPPGDPAPRCDEIDYVLNDEGPFEVGTHDIVISLAPEEPEGEAGDVLCETTLTVEDTEPPAATDETIELWPPNHKFHTISGSDCVKDRCDGEDLEVTFSYATSDEPVNDKGDGNTEPDIVLSCSEVMLRAERQGPSNGRVYRLGWRAVDDAGNETEGECVVVVPHDQSGREAIDDGAAYTVELDDDACDDGQGGAGGAGGAAGEGGAGGAGGEGGEGGAGGAGGEGGAGGVTVP
jgi:hypothetical protein